MQQQDLAGGGAAARRVDCDVCRRVTPSLLVFEDRISGIRSGLSLRNTHEARAESAPGLYMRKTRETSGPLCVLILNSAFHFWS